MPIIMPEGLRGEILIDSRHPSVKLRSHGLGDEILLLVQNFVPMFPHVPCRIPQFEYDGHGPAASGPCGLNNIVIPLLMFCPSLN